MGSGWRTPSCKYIGVVSHHAVSEHDRDHRGAACNIVLPNKLGEDGEAKTDRACQASKTPDLSSAPLHSAVHTQR